MWVELGLQTIHERSAQYIRRGYRLDCFEQAVRELRSRELEVIVHTILGLPGESMEDMLNTIDYVGHTDTQGIKLQLLHVLKGTDLAAEYKAGAVRTMELSEYINVLELCIRHLPRSMVIHRLTGDGPKRLLIAPEWSGNKRMVMNTIIREFYQRNVEQGSLYMQ